MVVNTRKTNTKMIVSSPFHPEISTRARRLSGEWDGKDKVWIFDLRDEERVKKMLMKLFGCDGETCVPTVTIQLRALQRISELRAGVFAGYRTVAFAYGRNSGARLGAGVVQLEGSINSGGSMKNWYTVISEGSVFELKDFPITLIGDIGDCFEVTVLDSTDDTINLLQELHEAYLENLKQIEDVLSVLKGKKHED